MKYQNKILSVLKEAQGEQLSSRVQKSADDIKTMYQSTVQNMKSLPGVGDDEAEDLATAAISSAVKTEGETITEVGDKEVHTDKFDRCVKDVEEKGDVDNPYAICQASIGAGAIKKDHRTKPDDEYDRTDRADESIDTLEVPDDVKAKEQDYKEMQRLMQQAAEEGVKNESVVGKIKKDELERVMESLKPKKKIIKVKELKKSK